MAGFVPMMELRVWIACLAIIAAIVIPQFQEVGALAEAQGLGFFGVFWMFIKAHWILSSIAGFVVLWYCCRSWEGPGRMMFMAARMGGSERSSLDSAGGVV